MSNLESNYRLYRNRPNTPALVAFMAAKIASEPMLNTVRPLNQAWNKLREQGLFLRSYVVKRGGEQVSLRALSGSAE